MSNSQDIESLNTISQAKFPEHFYTIGHDVSYTREPVGPFVLKQLLAGSEKHYLHNKPAPGKKKILIFCGDLVYHVNYQDSFSIGRYVLKQAVDAGFFLYAYDGKELHQINGKIDWYFHHIRLINLLPPMNQNILDQIEILAQHLSKVSCKDDYLILDRQQLQSLFAREHLKMITSLFSPPKILLEMSNVVTMLRICHNLDALLCLIENLPTQNKLLSIQIDNLYCRESTLKVEHLLKLARIAPNLKALSLDLEIDINFEKDILPHIQQTELFSQLQHVSLKKMSLGLINFILTRSQIKILELYSCVEALSELIFKDFCPLKLEKIRIYEPSPSNYESILSLLQHAPNLEELELINFEEFESEQIISLLRTIAPRVKRLLLDYVSPLNMAPSNIAFSQLEELTLKNIQGRFTLDIIKTIRPVNGLKNLYFLDNSFKELLSEKYFSNTSDLNCLLLSENIFLHTISNYFSAYSTSHTDYYYNDRMVNKISYELLARQTNNVLEIIASNFIFVVLYSERSTLLNHDVFYYAPMLSQDMSQCDWNNQASLITQTIANHKTAFSQVCREKLTYIPNRNSQTQASNTSKLSQQPIYQEPSYNSQSYFKPTEKPTTPFDSTNHTLNQGMITGKIYKYLLYKGKGAALAPILEMGICYSLSAWYRTTTFHDFMRSLTRINKWDVSTEPSTELASDFKELIFLIKQHYQDKKVEPLFYHGESIKTLLRKPGDYLISNIRHTVMVRFNGHSYEFYDSNSPSGPKRNLDLNSVLTCLQTSSLGHLLCIHQHSPPTSFNPPQIDVFFNEGGLLLLTKIKNAEELFKKLPPASKINTTLLPGLLIYTIYNQPAWVKCLRIIKSSEMLDYIFDLLNRYLREYPEGMNNLINSLSHCNSEFINDFLKSSILKLTQRMHKGAYIPLCQLFRTIESHQNQQYYETLMTTNSHLTPSITLEQLTNQLFTANHKNQWVEFYTKKEAEQFSYYLIHHAHTHQIPLYYASQLEELSCGKVRMEHIKEGTWQLAPGYSGNVYDFLAPFLQQRIDIRIYVVMNYSNFNANQRLKSSTWVDSLNPNFNGILLPHNLRVIALSNSSSPNNYKGKELTSRFAPIIPILTSMKFKNVLPPEPKLLPFEEAQSRDDVVRINLFQAPDWESILLGKYIMGVDGYFHEEPGALEIALKAQKTIIIENPPTQDLTFNDKLIRARCQGTIKTIQGILEIPQGTEFIFTQGYDWQRLRLAISCLELNQFMASKYVLNSATFYSLLQQQHIQNNAHHLIQEAGWIVQHKGATLSPMVTAPLDTHQWARMLTASLENHVNLHLFVAPNVFLPECISSPCSSSSSSTLSREAFPLDRVHLIESTDVAATTLLLQNTDWQALDITDANTCDFFHYESAQLQENENKITLSFSSKEGVLFQLFNQGKNVILYGDFSQEFIDVLTKFLLSPAWSQRDQKLTLITKNANCISFIAAEKITVTPEIKRRALLKYQPLSNVQLTESEIDAVLTLKEISEKPFIYLVSKIIHKRISANYDGWQSTSTIEFDLPYNKTTRAEDSLSWLTQRRDFILHLLTHMPMLELTGASGVGKTTFIQEELSKIAKVHMGMQHFDEFKMSPLSDTERFNILFSDEENLSKKSPWTTTAMLLNPRGMVRNGCFHLFNPSQRILTAGNPAATYTSGRRELTAFSETGFRYYCEPLPSCVIAEYILKPLLEETPLAHQCETIIDRILEAYEWVLAITQREIVITPRDLKMMVILILPYVDNDALLFDCLNRAIHQVLTSFVPEQHVADFNSRYLQSRAVDDILLPHKTTDFKKVNSILNSYQLLDDFLNSTHWRRQYDKQLSKEKRYLFSALGGVILEGDSSVGKSKVTFAVLEEHNYVRIDSLDKGDGIEKGYYVISVDMNHKEIEALLLHAHRAGFGIVIEELNSLAVPRLEKVMNALLNDKDLEGNGPDRSGFFIIASMNPESQFPGRRPLSVASKRRFISHKTTPQTPEEKEEILKHLFFQQALPQQITPICRAAEKTNLNLRQLIQLTQQGLSLGFNPLNFPELPPLLSNEVKPLPLTNDTPGHSQPLPKSNSLLSFFNALSKRNRPYSSSSTSMPSPKQ